MLSLWFFWTPYFCHLGWRSEVPLGKWTYRCSSVCDILQRKKIQHISYVVISKCLEHNTLAVCCFQESWYTFHRQKFLDLKKIYYFSDSSAAQYKNNKNSQIYVFVRGHREFCHRGGMAFFSIMGKIIWLIEEIGTMPILKLNADFFASSVLN